MIPVGALNKVDELRKLASALFIRPWLPGKRNPASAALMDVEHDVVKNQAKRPQSCRKAPAQGIFVQRHPAANLDFPRPAAPGGFPHLHISSLLRPQRCFVSAAALHDAPADILRNVGMAEPYRPPLGKPQVRQPVAHQLVHYADAYAQALGKLTLTEQWALA
jgi:hypothetical protein